MQLSAKGEEAAGEDALPNVVNRARKRMAEVEEMGKKKVRREKNDEDLIMGEWKSADEEDKENYVREKSKKRPKSKLSRELEEVGEDLRAVRGHIAMVHLTDFMVHRDFIWRPGHCVNFITGKNGSGKSSLLQGIVLGLMSGARHVGRYKSIGQFVRRGCRLATVAVTLHNTGEAAYRPGRFGLTVTFRRTIAATGTSKLELLDSDGEVVVGGRAALPEAAAVLRRLDIQLENPLTILQQDHAKEMLQVEKPDKLYAFFESATMIAQCRQEYSRSAAELEAVARNMASLKEGMQELKAEANQAREVVNQGIRSRKMDQQCELLKGQRAWATVVRERRAVAKRRRDMEQLGKKREGIANRREKCERELKELQEKELLVKSEMTGKEVEKEVGIKTHELAKEKKKLKSDKKVIVAEIKKLRSKQRAVESDLKVLEEMRRKAQAAPNSDLVARIEKLERELEKVVMSREVAEGKAEEVEGAVVAAVVELRAAEVAVTRQQREVARLGREVRELGERKAEREVYQGAEVVAGEVGSRREEFTRRPVGPVGKHVRVAGDRELVALVEAQLSPRLLRAYLVDNSGDARVLSEILHGVYGATKAKPMIIVSKFLARRHQVELPAASQGCQNLAELVEVQGGEEEQVQVYNCLVDRAGMEGVVVAESQGVAGALCQAPRRAVTMAVSLDWYKFYPPTNSTAFRSFYMVKAPALLLSPTGAQEQWEARRGELEEAERDKQVAAREVEELVRRREEVGRQAKVEREQLERARKKEAEVKAKLRREQQRREEEKVPLTVEVQVEGKRREEGELLKAVEAKKEAVKKVELAIVGVEEEETAEAQRMVGVSEVEMEVRRRLEEVQAAVVAMDTRRAKEEEKLEALLNEESVLAAEVGRMEEVVAGLEEEARSVTGGEEVEVEESVEKLTARINTLVAEQLGREVGDYGTAALERYTELAAEIHARGRRVAELRELHARLQEQMERRRELFKTLREKVVDMVERRFAVLAAGSLGAMHLRLRIDPVRKQLGFTFGPERRSSSVGSMSGGEKSYSQLCLILSLWYFMATPFRCLDEWDVFLDSVNRAAIGAELTRFAKEQEGIIQFIFLSPQGAVEAPEDAGPEFRVFTLGQGGG